VVVLLLQDRHLALQRHDQRLAGVLVGGLCSPSPGLHWAHGPVTAD
jgi:hypothetical protein